jgi:hypothetical protein
LNPPWGATLSEYVALAPGEIVIDCGEPEATLIVKSAPVPETGTTCGLPPALSAIDIVPLSGPPCVGAKVTWMAQCAKAGTLDPQSFVSWKEALAEMPVMFSGVPPEFVRVTV